MTQSKLLQEYRKERRRVQQLVRRYEKRGYIFNKEIVPQTPKKITAGSVRRLKKITPEKVFESAFGWVEKRTGEVLTAIQGRAKERQATREKQREAAIIRGIKKVNGVDWEPAKEEDIIIDNLIDTINEDIPLPWVEERRNVLLNILETAIVNFGRKGVAINISENIDRLQSAVERALLDSDPTRSSIAIAEFAEILKGEKLTTLEEENLGRIFESDIDSEFYENI